MKTLGWIIFVFFAIVIGVYPFLYLVFDMSQGLLASKTPELLGSLMWKAAFYTHIFLGGIALLVGWSQFSKRIRNRNLKLHRFLGKTYVVTVCISGVAGLYIAMYASGGIVPVLGFAGLAIAWLFTTVTAYRKIKAKNIDDHEVWMIRSYALCFAAVTLRFWLPLFQIGFGMDFYFAYKIIAWLCWVPNLVVAEMIVRRVQSRRKKTVRASLVNS
jgi:uncharacterized membrane protein